MEDPIISVALEVGKCLLGPIGRQLSHLRNYSDNLENLKKQVEKLKYARVSVQHKVDEARRQGEQIEEIVENWRTRVNKTIGEVENFVEDEREAKKRCFMGLCPNLKNRYQHSKKAAAETKTIVELLEESGKFQKVSYSVIPEEIWLKSNRGYEAFESRLSTLKNIKSTLSDPNVSIIGLFGMGGIGKTTLVKEIARQVKEEKLFDQVVFAEVSQQTVDIKNIQAKIAEKLGLELREETESGRASRLSERLKNEKKILVVLDNLWRYLDLEKVGIPYGDDHRGCKLLLTTRDSKVLLSMSSKNNFSIDVLNEEESWRLFKKMVGDDVENRKLKSTAMDVAKACKGLPIAIVTIARALKKKSLPEWKNALRELQTPSSANFEGVPAEAYSTIELSYKYLKGKLLKKTFLLCSLMSHPCASILDLLKYGIGLGIFQGVNGLEDARNKLYALVQELKDSCLLLEADGEIFSMHDIVCDVAISIACRDQHAFVVRSKDVWEWPDEDALKKCNAISIIDSSTRELPERLECPQLESFYMSSRDFSVKFPDNFFTGMRKLRALDLTMQLFAVPSSIHLLVNLKTLCLDHAMLLGDTSIIGKLKNLETLSFRYSDIVQLPVELGQLTKLSLLDLTYCHKLKVITPNVISSLTRLEELYMKNCFVEWEDEGLNSRRSNASLDELMHLHRLTTLEIDLKTDNILPKGFFSKKLERYKISVGDGVFEFYLGNVSKEWFRFNSWYFSETHKTSRNLKLKLNCMNIFSENLRGIKNVEFLGLDMLPGVKNVVFELDNEGFTELKHLHVQNNSQILCIVDSMEQVPYDAFPILESLTLHNLVNLEEINRNLLIAESFSELNTIKLKKCGNLLNVFSLSTTQCLPRLQRIAVIDCEKMQENFALYGEDEVDDKIVFPQLNFLSLGNLPELKSFYCRLKTPSILPDGQEELMASTTLFNEKVVLPNLEALDLYKINVKMIWHNQLPAMSHCFQRLTRLIVWECQNLTYLFSSSIVIRFEQLQNLEICDCVALKEIIAEEGAETTSKFVFPRMTTLILYRLPRLRCLYPGMHTSEWPVLEKLEAFYCPRLKIFDSKLFSFQKTNEESQFDIEAQQPLFLVEKVRTFDKLM